MHMEIEAVVYVQVEQPECDFDGLDPVDDDADVDVALIEAVVDVCEVIEDTTPLNESNLLWC